MLSEPTMEKLSLLRLHALAHAWQQQSEDPASHDLAFDERLGLLVEAEWLDRQNKRLKRALKEAKLRIGSACLEDIDFAAERKLDRKKVRELSSCQWIANHQTDAAAVRHFRDDVARELDVTKQRRREDHDKRP